MTMQLIVDIAQTVAIILLARSISRLADDRDLLINHVHKLVFDRKREGK